MPLTRVYYLSSFTNSKICMFITKAIESKHMITYRFRKGSSVPEPNMSQLSNN